MCKFSGVKPASAMKVNAYICATDRDLESFLSKSASVRTRKMGNLRLSTAKSGATLVEARSDTDIQIVRRTSAWKRKANRTI